MAVNKKNKMNYYFGIVILVMVILLIYSILFRRTMIVDVIINIIFFVMIFYFDRKLNLSFWAILFLTLAISLSTLASLWLYSFFIIPGLIGFDKLVHFTAAFAVAYLTLEIISEKRPIFKYIIVILIVMGLGSIVEVGEFIGTRYFDVNNGGVFDISDNLPLTSDLQRYDTYFDMITNFLGSLFCVIIVGIKEYFFLRKRSIF